MNKNIQFLMLVSLFSMAITVDFIPEQLNCQANGENPVSTVDPVEVTIDFELADETIVQSFQLTNTSSIKRFYTLIADTTVDPTAIVKIREFTITDSGQVTKVDHTSTGTIISAKAHSNYVLYVQKVALTYEICISASQSGAMSNTFTC
jgi:hypothetical protein